MATIKSLILEQLSDRPMTVSELSELTGHPARNVSRTLQRMSKDWDVKMDVTRRGEVRKWKLTVKPTVVRRWNFKELLQAWRPQ